MTKPVMKVKLRTKQLKIKPVRTPLSYSIRSNRQKLGLTQGNLAKLCGVTISVISHYENGRCNPSIKVLNQMASALHTSVGNLLEGKQ